MGRLCKICNIYLAPGVWAQHEAGKKHRKLLHKSNLEKASKCLFVSNLPSGVGENQLRSQLKSYPGVVKVEVKKYEHTAVLTFKNEDFAKSFASSTHYLGGRELRTVTPLICPPEPQIQQNTSLDINLPTRNQLLAEENVEAQMHFLVEHFSLKEKTVMQRLEICAMLEAVMRNFFPNCMVIPYGSCANGLGMTDSDLDLFVDLKVVFNNTNENNQSRVLSTLMTNLDSYKHQAKSFENFRFLNKVQSLNGRIIINVVKQIIKRYAPECVDLFCVPQARCPIVTFVHRPTQACCDVSVQNGLAVHNTVLVRLFQQLDPRVHPLLFTIRYWAKRMQLVDSKRNRFSSYAITMLAIFYLQNCSPTVLPTVETLQQLSHSNAMCYGWKCHFCMEQEKIPKTANREPLDILLAGFFNYYTKVDLVTNVLCLRTGKVMSHPEFQEYLQCNENLHDFKMSILNVQDTFELNFNITRGLNATGLDQWNAAISQARSICSSGALWEKISDHHAWGLICLLSIDPSSTINAQPSKRKRKLRAEEEQQKSDGCSVQLPAKKKKRKNKKKAAVTLGNATAGPSTVVAAKNGRTT